MRGSDGEEDRAVEMDKQIEGTGDKPCLEEEVKDEIDSVGRGSVSTGRRNGKGEEGGIAEKKKEIARRDERRQWLRRRRAMGEVGEGAVKQGKEMEKGEG